MTRTDASRATVFVDADNTLWETDRVYAEAQLGLLMEVERALDVVHAGEDRLAFVRALDQGLAEKHHAGLRYPPRMLIGALSAVLSAEDPAVAVRRVLKGNAPASLPEETIGTIETAYLERLKAPPALRPGVIEGLRTLQSLGCLVIVVTEGAHARITRTAAKLGLTSLFDRTIEAPKHERLYRRVRRLARTPNPAFMVGDQLERDIAPAKLAGLRTIYFPGGFRPRWERDEAQVQPDFRVSRFDEVADIVRRHLDVTTAPD